MRFSLAASLVLLSLTSILCFLATTKAEIPAFILSLLILTLAPVVLAALVTYGQGNLRAFAFGASIPMLLLVFASQNILERLSAYPMDYATNEFRNYQNFEDPFGSAYWTFEQVAPKTIKRTWSFSTLSVLGGFITLGLRAALQKPAASPSDKASKSLD